jgi:hypothetical protein
MYARGATLAEVASEYGVTRERVRQIFKKAGLPTISLADRRRLVYQQRADEIVEKYRGLRDVRAVADALCVPMSAVDEILRQRLPAAEFRKHGNYPKKYSDDELIAMLHEASRALGGVLAKTDFESHARDRTLPDGRPWPTAQTHMLRFGSWRNSLIAAGLTANASSPITGQILFDEAQCIDAIRHVARELKKVPTAAQYEKHARGTSGALPSMATVRNRCGRWYEALAKAGL